jgi:redox-sensitive bicupin YhaK (pirin superfamily)
MINKRPAAERGHADHGWLDTWHTFSFAGYHDPRYMGFQALRVINEDRVEPGRGFGTHPHDNMEILTYVIEGELEHKDSMGNGSIIRPGDVQHMSAGSGVTHSEFNPSRTDAVHLLQIWIIPERRGTPPSYSQAHFPAEQLRQGWKLVASRDGRDGSVSLLRDVDLYAARLEPGQAVEMPLRPGRHAWLQIVEGTVSLNGYELETSDGAAISEESRLVVAASRPSHLLLFDLD